MRKGERLAVLEENMKALDPEQNKVYNFLVCEQPDKTEVKKIMERVKKEAQNRTERWEELKRLSLKWDMCKLREGDMTTGRKHEQN